MCGPGPSVANGEQVEYLFRFNNGYNILNINNTTSGYKYGYLKWYLLSKSTLYILFQIKVFAWLLLYNFNVLPLTHCKLSLNNSLDNELARRRL